MTNEAKITLDSTGAHINSQDVADALAKKNLSASLITGIEGCPARWLADTFVIRDIIEQDKDNPATRGSLFHRVMEHFFAIEPELREPNLIKDLVKKTMLEDDFTHFATNKEATQWLREAINGYYNMGGDPKTVKIADIDTPKGSRPGLELFVKGKIGDTERQVLGFIDRVIVDPRDEKKIIVEDWKSGAKAKHWKGNLENGEDGRVPEGIPEQRQQMIYTMLLEQQGLDVSMARLLYPVAREVVKVRTENDDLRKRVVDDVENADKALTHMTEQNTFDCKPSFLCSWCPLAKLCPVADLKRNPRGKLKAAIDSQPRPEDLYPTIQGI